MINRVYVGVKLPVDGRGEADDVDTDVGEGLGDGEGDGDGVGDGLGVTEAEGVDSKDGPSDAWTTNVLVRVLSMPPASLQEIVIVCDPGARLLGGDQFQDPLDATV